MRFWTLEAFQAASTSVVSMVLLVAFAAWLARRLKFLSSMPRALVAGAFGLTLGPPLFNLLDAVSRMTSGTAARPAAVASQTFPWCTRSINTSAARSGSR